MNLLFRAKLYTLSYIEIKMLLKRYKGKCSNRLTGGIIGVMHFFFVMPITDDAKDFNNETFYL